MKVVLTGDRGYIGTVLAPKLLARGVALKGIDADLFRACTFLGDLAEYEQVTKDVRRVASEDFVGADAVLHLAGLSNDPLGDYAPHLTAEINENASVRVAVARLSWISSASLSSPSL